MIYKTTASIQKQTIIMQIIPKTYEGKVTHTHTHTHKELAPNNYAMTFNTTSITVLVSVQHVSTYKALHTV
jgi:hypothetical protein